MLNHHHHHHFLVVAYPVQGHINPALQLSKRLVALGSRVTLSTTLHMHRRMTNKPTLPGLSFLPFSDSHDHGFSAASESDYSLYLSDLKRHGSEFITNLILSTSQQSHPFTCVVYTILQTWVAEVARRFHLPTALLWIQPATVFDIFYHYFHGYGNYINDKSKEPSSSEEVIELPGLSSPLAPRDLPAYLLPSASGANSFHSIFAPKFEEQFRELDIETNPTRGVVLVNTFEALEAEALRAVDDKCNVISIGPLIPSALLDGKDPTDTSHGYIEWLDSKAEMSVVYVSFGSVCVLSERQMEEIARALLDCGYPFLWVIRENREKGGEELEDKLLLRESCIEELKKRGKIVKWCSQLEVLSHGSLGCFVTHCGWNSTLESLVSGVPLVALPQQVEQRTNAKLIEDVWKTGVRVDHDHDHEDGVVKADEIRRCLDVVMGSGERGNNEFRMNAKRWKILAMDAVKESGSSDKNLMAFLDHVGRSSYTEILNGCSMS